MMKRKAELLAPAGGPEQLKAALYAGADAVYLGYRSFSARAGAQNFDEVQLKEAVCMANVFGAKCYLACNTLYTDKEREEIVDLIKLAANVGIDAVILQDLGLCRLLRKTVPDMKLHASTQLSVHTPAGAKQLAEMGFSRVVLARELSLSEIESFFPCPIETEVFVHGALCFSFSGQCYMSGFLGGRSANRGRCAQPCRLPFSVEKNGSADLSLKDLCAANYVKSLCDLGVTSLKIEGRMKRPEYVFAATDAYRAILDGKTPDLDSLRKVFSRNGFTDGYLTAKRDKEMFGERQKEDIVSPALLKELKNRYRKPVHKVALSGNCLFSTGEPARLEVSDGTHRVKISGEVARQANQKPLEKETVKRLLNKLEDTPFYWDSVDVKTVGSPYLPVSEINRLRRNAINELVSRRGDPKPLKVSDQPPPIGGGVPQMRHSPALRAKFDTVSQIGDTSFYQYIYLPVDEILSNEETVKSFKDKIIATLPTVRFGTEQRLLSKIKLLKEIGVRHLLASNVADFGLKDEFVLHGDHTLHPANSDTLEFLADMGLEDTLLSAELRREAIKNISSPIPFGIMIYGNFPLMISRNCPVKAKTGCEQCGKKAVLTDRLGKKFPVRCKDGYCEILNSVPVSLLDLPWRERVSFGCLCFTNESRFEAEQITKKAINSEKPCDKYTRGFYNRDNF